ncbi:hypothetical protein UPYG_G00152540 [Umbra pygmaea]|uniref:Uncharacterized protein n=1 Tax=Umbra pygmaea TaxID=75934 RepID=A0ABD0XJY4_UMBPY
MRSTGRRRENKIAASCFKMSHHPRGRALTDKQNALHVFCKHFKSTEKTCTTDRPMPHCYSSSHTKNTEAQHRQLTKTKRLKTRKERSQVKGGRSKSKSHHQHQGGKEKEHTQGCCQSSSRPSLCRGVPFARIFSAEQEPSIITDNRLIGHQGLFNHEVKSIDIERLLSKQRKLEKLGHFGVHCKETASLPTCPSAFFPVSTPKPVVDEGVVAFVDNNEDASDKGRAKISKNTMKSRKCDDCESNSESRPLKCSHIDRHDGVNEIISIDCYYNSQESVITQQTQQSAMASSESKVVNVLSTESPSCVMGIKSRMPRPIAPETDRKSLLSPCGKNENTPDTRFSVQNMVLTLDQTPENHVLPATQPQGRSPKITELPSSARIVGNEVSDHQTHQTDPNHIRAVAVRLCRSLQFPLLHGRQLVEESREVLLQTLRERHGPNPQENLIKVQRHLSFSTGTNITRTGQVQSITPNEVWTAALLDGSCEESMPEQLFQKSACKKRSRKQLCPVRATPPLPLHWPEYSLNTNSVWTASMEELNGKIHKAPSSSHFLLNLQPSSSSSPNNIFVPTSASCWAAQSSPTLPWDKNFNRKIMRESTRADHLESWRHTGPRCSGRTQEQKSTV